MSEKKDYYVVGVDGDDNVLSLYGPVVFEEAVEEEKKKRLQHPHLSFEIRHKRAMK